MYTFKIYRDRTKQWRWSLIANNKKVVSDSAESYTRRAGASKFPDKMIKRMPSMFKKEVVG